MSGNQVVFNSSPPTSPLGDENYGIDPGLEFTGRAAGQLQNAAPKDFLVVPCSTPICVQPLPGNPWCRWMCVVEHQPGRSAIQLEPASRSAATRINASGQGATAGNNASGRERNDGSSRWGLVTARRRGQPCQKALARTSWGPSSSRAWNPDQRLPAVTMRRARYQTAQGFLLTGHSSPADDDAEVQYCRCESADSTNDCNVLDVTLRARCAAPGPRRLQLHHRHLVLRGVRQKLPWRRSVVRPAFGDDY